MGKPTTVLSYLGESLPQCHVEARDWKGMVHLASSSGSCSFFHQMTTAQARELAAALVAHATAAEAYRAPQPGIAA